MLDQAIFWPQNGQKWPILVVCAYFLFCRPIFFIKITIKIWGRVISVWIHLDPAIFGPQKSSKWAKMAYFGSFLPFDTLYNNLLSGTNWISPKNH